jgi:hypothetical protein
VKTTVTYSAALYAYQVDLIVTDTRSVIRLSQLLYSRFSQIYNFDEPSNSTEFFGIVRATF